jgi:hypothetical protein
VRRTLCASLLVPALAAAALLLPSGPAAAWPGPDGAYDWPGMKKCGSFPARYRIYVYANKRLGCRKARKVMKAWWLGKPGTVVEHDGPTGGYVTLKRFPGWRCDSGAGGGGCRKGRRVAGYQN